MKKNQQKKNLDEKTIIKDSSSIHDNNKEKIKINEKKMILDNGSSEMEKNNQPKEKQAKEESKKSVDDEIENKSSFVNILENTSNAKGVQIFIGSQNFLFKHSGLSMVMAPYKNKDQKIIGAIGVVGPTRLNYAKIVPLVDYTSKIIGGILS